MERMMIYVAGKLTDLAQGYIINLKQMCDHGTMVKRALLKEGIETSIYIPGEDFMRALCDGTYTREELFNNSQGFLERSDCLSILPNWKTSKGTRDEIDSANKQGVPVFYGIGPLVEFAKGLKIGRVEICHT